MRKELQFGSATFVQSVEGLLHEGGHEIIHIQFWKQIR